MPAARGVKRAASKSTASSAASSAPKTKKKRGASVQLAVPALGRRRGRVFACGQGDVGQLGLGEDVQETTKFKHVPALGDNIVSVCAGGMHTIALDSTGKVWTYGCNDEGALGRNTTGEKDEGTPKKVTLPAKAVSVSAGDSHSAALLDNGQVYAWGSFRDSHGSMGLVVRGREGKACRAPVHVDLGETAVDIASGSDHLVILSQSGAVYTMGCGEQGQLGRLAQRSASREARQGFSALLTPGKVTLKGGAARVWAGYHATFLLHAASDKVYAFGLNNYGQLGITGEKRKTALYAPVECDAFSRAGGEWRAVAAGQHHSLALSAAGRVHAVGRCDYGRLGLGEGAADAAALEPVPALADKTVLSIAAGISNSFAVTDQGEVFAWGMGSEGQLGTGGSADAAAPVPAVCVALDSHRPAAVAAGGQHTVLLVEDPNAKNEPSPEPESEPAEEKIEEGNEETEEEEVEEKPKAKRQKKEKEVAAAKPVAEDTKPQKVNGDDKDAAMDVDDTDNKQEDDKSAEKPESEEKMETDQAESRPDNTDTSSQDTDSDAKSQGSEAKSQDTEAKSHDSDAKSQDSDAKSHDSETKSQDSETKSQDSETKSQESDAKSQDKESQDVDMTEKAEVNGTEESEKVESKTVDVPNNPLSSTA